MDANSKKIEFFKNKIRQRLKELCPYMSDVKYRLYNSMINDCQSLDDIREMAELDMQFSMIKYVQELDDKLKKSDTNIDELEAVTSQNNRAAKLAVIAPKKERTAKQYDDVDLTNIVDDLDDPEILNTQADLLMARMAAEKLSGYTEDDEEDSEDDELYDEMFVDSEEDEDTEDSDISEYEDYIEDDENGINSKEDSTNSSDDDFIDFGDSSESEDDTEEELEESDDDLIDDMFDDEDDIADEDDSSENEEETDDELLDNMFDDEDDNYSEDEDSENDDNDDDLDNINLDDIFGDEEEDDNDFDINEEDLGYTSDNSGNSFDDFFKDCDTKTSKKAVKRELTPNKVFINGTSKGTQTQQMFSLILNVVKGVDKTSQKVYNGIRRKIK